MSEPTKPAAPVQHRDEFARPLRFDRTTGPRDLARTLGQHPVQPARTPAPTPRKP